MYRQTLPVLYLPSRSISGATSNPGVKYKVRSPLRGEKAAMGHSPSRPLSYLWRYRPKPTILLPHIAGSSLVTSRIISRTVKQSSRRVLSETALRNFVTLAVVGLVFGSPILLFPEFAATHN